MRPTLLLFLAVSLGQHCHATDDNDARVWHKSALARAGLHHATVTGRFVDADRRPVAGVRVQLVSGLPRVAPVAEAVSGADGRIQFTDINTSSTQSLRWYPDERWLEGGMTIVAESASNYDLGDIVLTPNTTVRVVLELVGGKPLERSGLGPMVVLQREGTPPARIVARQRGSIYFLDQIQFSDGNWSISLYGADPTETYSAPAHIEVGHRDQLFHIRLLRDTVKPDDDNEASGELEITELRVPEQSSATTYRAEGRLVAPDQTPIAGVRVEMFGIMAFDRVAPRWTTSAKDGRFSLTYDATECREPQFVYGPAEGWFFQRDKEAPPCEQRYAAARDVVMPAATRLILKPSGIEPARVEAKWWHASQGWLPFNTLEPWISLHWYKRDFVVGLFADGRFPVVRSIELPNVDVSKGEKPPAHFDADFSFANSVARELVVTSQGKPVAGAIVDIEWIRDLARDTRLPIGTYRTADNGTLRLDGGADQRVEAFVYADGFEPGRIVWTSGEPARLELAPRSATLSFPHLRPGAVARIRRADRPTAVRTLIAAAGKPLELRVAPATYDVLVYGNTGQVLGSERVVVEGGQRRSVDVHTDTRPRLVVRYDEPGWRASVSESTPSGMPVGWAAYSTAGGQTTIRDIDAVLERETGSEAVFHVSRAGRHHVQISGFNQIWWREVDLAPGATVTLTVPRRTAALHGSMRSYGGGKGFSHHGWAGPRMQLIADSSDAWSVTVYLPTRESDDGFTLRDLPAGAYTVYQHLIGTPKTYKGNDGKDVQYSSPLDAWGGIPVTLEPNATATLKDFIDYPFRDCAVTVEDSAGKPLHGATVRVRDRMSEAWRQVGEGPTTLSNAADPIPYPTAARVENGRAMLRSIRAGRLEILVELDDGRVFPLTCDVDPEVGLRIRLPRNGGAQ